MQPPEIKLDQQVDGYWFPQAQALPTAPSGPPTGAILLPQGLTFPLAHVFCLDLAPIDGHWQAVSRSGPLWRVHRHAEGILYKENWVFVPVETPATPWPAAYLARLAPAQASSIAFDPAALTHLRADQPPAILQLHRTILPTEAWTILSSTIGRRRLRGQCPYCRMPFEGFAWSLAGSGKRCACGAKIRTNYALWDR